MQTMMSGMWARMSLRLDAFEILSVSFVMRLSQPGNPAKKSNVKLKTDKKIKKHVLLG
jgi:hypothetical protein